MSDQPDDVHLAQMAATIAAGLVEGTLSDLVRADDASRNVVADLSVDLAQRIVRRLTAEHAETSARDEFIAGVTDDLGFAEWSSAEHGERVLRALIDKWHPRGRSLLKESR